MRVSRADVPALEETKMASNEAMIVAGVRTPIGAMNGGLAAVPATQLGATCVKALVARTGVPADQVDEVIMGNCIAAGLGMNPARQVAIFGGLPPSAGATTLNRACASGMKAVLLANQAIGLGDAELIIAGGIENMTRAPYLLLKGREGYRMGHGELSDALIYDGLTDAFSSKHMGVFADRCARNSGSPGSNKMTLPSAATPAPARRSRWASPPTRSCRWRSRSRARPRPSPPTRGRFASTRRNCGA